MAGFFLKIETSCIKKAERIILEHNWLFPDETNPDADPDDLGGGQLPELQQRGTIIDSDEANEDDTQDAGEKAPYFDSEGRLILQHDGVSYLIDTLDDDVTYFGVSNIDNLYTTDDKTNQNTDLRTPPF